MSNVISANKPVSINTETLLAVKTANLVNSQTEREGKMALALLASAVIDNISLPVIGNSGQNINIKV